MLLILDEDQPLVFVRLTLHNHVNQSQLWLVVCAAAINAEIVERVEYEILLPRESLYNTILQGSASQAQVTLLLDNFYPFDNNFTGVACRSRRHWDSQGGQRWPPHPVAAPSSPTRFEHANRFYCFARKSLVPSLNSGKTAVTTSCPSGPRVHVEISGGAGGGPQRWLDFCAAHFGPNISTQFDFACHGR